MSNQPNDSKFDADGINWIVNADGDRGQTINPVIGCSKADPTCNNCYALTMAKRLKNMGMAQYQEGVVDEQTGEWSGKTTTVLSQLEKLLNTSSKVQKAYFLGSMGDVFHPSTPEQALELIFATIALTPWSFYFLLTKRPDRMAGFVDRMDLLKCLQTLEKSGLKFKKERLDAAFAFYEQKRSEQEDLLDSNPANRGRDLLPNTMLGASIGMQRYVAQRLPHIQSIVALGWNGWISAEPVIQSIDFGFGDIGLATTLPNLPELVVLGGESRQPGKPARKFDYLWANSIQRQCYSADIRFWFKQTGDSFYYDGQPWRHAVLQLTRNGHDPNKMLDAIKVQERPVKAFGRWAAHLNDFRRFC